MLQSTDTCQVCDGSGWEPIITDGIRRMRRCEQCDYWDRKRGIPSGLPRDEADTTLASYGKGGKYSATAKNREALEHAQHTIDGVHPNLYIYGGVGTGKTTLACAILNELHKRGQRGVFIRVTELLQRLLPGSEHTDVAYDGAINPQVVVLDDVGASQGTDFARRMLQSIFDARLDRGNRTIWTSNLDLDELGEFLGEDKRLPSRIVGSCKIVELNGPDHRVRKAAAAAQGQLPPSVRRGD